MVPHSLHPVAGDNPYTVRTPSDDEAPIHSYFLVWRSGSFPTRISARCYQSICQDSGAMYSTTVVLSTEGVIRVHNMDTAQRNTARLFAVPCNPFSIVYLTCTIRHNTAHTRSACKARHRFGRLSHDYCHVAPSSSMGRVNTASSSPALAVLLTPIVYVVELVGTHFSSANMKAPLRCSGVRIETCRRSRMVDLCGVLHSKRDAHLEQLVYDSIS